MHTYDEVTHIVSHELHADRVLETCLLAAILAGSPEQHHEISLKIVALGHEWGGRSTGRPIDEKTGRVPFHPKEIEKIGKDYTAVHVQLLSLSYSIIVQSPIREIEVVCRNSVCLLFDIGYKIGTQDLPQDDVELAELLTDESETTDSSPMLDDDELSTFLRSLI